MKQTHRLIFGNINMCICGMVFLMLTACSRSSVKIDDSLTPQQAKAVLTTEQSLSSGDEIVDYKVVEGTLPLAMLESEYKGVRDRVNKARIDYRTNITRNLQSVAQQNLATLTEIQSMIVEKDSALTAMSPQYIFVLAQVNEKSRRDGNTTGFIGIYDAENVQQLDFVQVTTPLYNNAVMVAEALNGTLVNPNPEAPDALETSNPVVDFILHSSPK